MLGLYRLNLQRFPILELHIKFVFIQNYILFRVRFYSIVEVIHTSNMFGSHNMADKLLKVILDTNNPDMTLEF